MCTLGTGPLRALWIGGIHGNEREGEVATQELPAAFLAEHNLGRCLTLTIVEDINPDGRASGERRNANGVDLNRNLPARNYSPGADRGAVPLSEPESRALHALLLELRPDVLLVTHSSSAPASGARAFVNFAGPAEELARSFSTQSGYPVVPSREMHSTPGSLGSFAGIDLGIPILTIEYERGRDPRACWNDTRAAILAVLAELIAPDTPLREPSRT
jgi:predicted deacylase